MSGFDHDDFIQRAMAQLVVLVTVVLAIIIQPDNVIAIIALWTVGCFATLWYFTAAKGTLYPNRWANDYRAVARYLIRRSR